MKRVGEREPSPGRGWPYAVTCQWLRTDHESSDQESPPMQAISSGCKAAQPQDGTAEVCLRLRSPQPFHGLPAQTTQLPGVCAGRI